MPKPSVPAVPTMAKAVPAPFSRSREGSNTPVTSTVPPDGLGSSFTQSLETELPLTSSLEQGRVRFRKPYTPTPAETAVSAAAV